MKKLTLAVVLFTILGSCSSEFKEEKRPNVLFVLSDDQSFPHTSYAGAKFVNTPAFDRIASEGMYFTNCYAGSPGCAPSRSAILTGRHHWQNEQSGQHASSWMAKHVPFIDELAANGYVVGRTGKGASPFFYGRQPDWRKENAGGPQHSVKKYAIETDPRTAKGINVLDYASNFDFFMDSVRTGSEPFFFWYGATEPHQPYEFSSWRRTNKSLDQVTVPGFLPDDSLVRGDMLDYAVEIEWFDTHLGKMIQKLEETGELDNTIVIVTSDNGMPFPSAKANAYEYGIHVPMAIKMPKGVGKHKEVKSLIGFVDLAPTILELCGVKPEKMLPITGKSFASLLKGESQGYLEDPERAVFAGRERHSSSRFQNKGYPQRAVRKQDFLLVWNMKPNLWPAGAPQKYNFKGELMPMYGLDENGRYIKDGAFTDIDDCPVKTHLIENHEKLKYYFDLATAKRPEFQLFNVVEDPFCLKNLVDSESYTEIFEDLKRTLKTELENSRDPRLVGPDFEVFDSYKRYSQLRKFPKPD